MPDFDWPARPTLTLEDDPGHRSITADYEEAESKADRRADAFALGLLTCSGLVGVLGIWQAVELIGRLF